MEILEIDTEVRFLKTLPHYLPAYTTLSLAAFVDGSSAPEREFHTLRQYRRALLDFIREGLGQEENDMGLPQVSLKISGGEHCAAPIFSWNGDVEEREEDGHRFWLVNLDRAKAPPERFAALEREAAVAIFEPVLETLFARWATEVVFDSTPNTRPSHP